VYSSDVNVSIRSKSRGRLLLQRNICMCCSLFCFQLRVFCLFDIPGFEVYISPDQCAAVVCLSLYCTPLSFCFISQTTCSILVSHFPVLSSPRQTDCAFYSIYENYHKAGRIVFSEHDYMLSPVRLSSVCLSVCL